MNHLTLTCRDEQRRHAVQDAASLNGMDYLEVEIYKNQIPPVVLCVHFLGPIPEAIAPENVRIEGGQRIKDIRVTAVEPRYQDDPTLDSCLRISLNKWGDFSTYTLRLIEKDAEGKLKPLTGFDPRYSQLNFRFTADCPSDLDCKTSSICPPAERDEPEINYLAKDYASFRQLILDRLSLIMPDWQERHIPDLGITLVELLAYVGDYLSYYQDAIATEAYLDTARQRISVRRHVRLVDYAMHEGCNARTWVWLETSEDAIDPPLPLQDVYFITRFENASVTGKILMPDDLRNVPAEQYDVFEPVIADAQATLSLYQAHNEIHFYSWGDRQCCLPKGATTATLLDAWEVISQSPAATQQPDDCDDDNPPPPPKLERSLHLKPGNFLIFEEVKGAKTGNPADADPAHRHVVRLTRVEETTDALYPQRLSNVASDLPTPLIEIGWDVADALPFPLCISAIGQAPDCNLIYPISVARGNVLLVDHGRSLPPEDLGVVMGQPPIDRCEAEGQPVQVMTRFLPFRSRLKYAPLTFRQPLSAADLANAPAARLLAQNPRKAFPQITSLVGTPPDAETAESSHWYPQPDLFSSRSQDQEFVVEIDNEGFAHLRFGDGELGRQPIGGTRFSATYRVGNGIAGNIGADTLAHVVFRQTRASGWLLQPHNPFPAIGGTRPESLSDVKLFAPHTFRKEIQRAITVQDYAQIVMRDFAGQVQRAAATLRWTGSWYEVLVVVDPLGAETASEELLTAIAHHLHRFRRIGHDLVVKSAVYVPLEIAMTVCVHRDYLRGQVKAALLEVLSDRILPDGRRGFFHPDNLTFGEGIALSRLVAAVQAVDGVESVTITDLKRWAEAPNQEIENGILLLSPLEIARLANDPSFPENGRLDLVMRGGRT